MSSVHPSFTDDSSSDDEFDLHKEEDIAMLVAMHKGKKPKHGGPSMVVSFGENRCSTQTVDAQLLWITTCFPVELVPTPFHNVERLVHPHLQFREAAQSSLQAENELCWVAWP